MLDVLRRLRALDPDRRAAVLARLATDGERFDVHPVSAGQRRLWLLDQVHRGLPVYSVPYAFRLAGVVDADALRAGLLALGARHEALRTVFLDVGGEPRQIVLPEPGYDLEVVDRPTPAADRDGDAAVLADDEARAPFDLAEGPLLRARLVRFAADDALLLVTLHHAVCDGWSTQVLFAELGLLLRDEPLPPNPVQYVDFTRWQAESSPAEQLAHWTAHLADAPPVLELPTDRPRPAVLAMRGEVEPFSWPVDLDAFCRAERVTPFTVLLAAWNVLLHRYSGQDDLVVGTGVAGRTRPELEGAVGFYVNTVALRTKVDPGAGFRALLGQVRDTVLAGQANQDVPFDAVVDALRTPRSAAHHPLFQTLVVMQDGEQDILELPGVAVTRVPSHMHTAKWDLHLAVTSASGGLAGSVEYDTDLYDRETVRALLGHLRTLLEGALADPERPVGLLPFATPAELALVVDEWNRATAPHLPGVLMHELGEATADRAPETTALEYRGRTMTFAELDAAANRLAHHLRAVGADRDLLVGLCLPRGLDLVVAVQGVLKSGAAYVPLDPDYPADRLSYMVHDCAARLVVTTAALAGRLPADTATVLLDEHADHLASLPSDRPARVNSPDDLAYVIYTSGSTGRPKGAMMTHRGAVNLADEQRRAFGTTPADRVLQFASASFDASVLEVLLGQHSGAAIVSVDRPDLQPGADLARTVRDLGITTMFLPPTVLRLMAPSDVPGLTTLIVGGETCPDEFAAVWAHGRQLRNIYGPTETTVWVTSAVGDGGPVAIGARLGSVRTYVLDDNLEPVPPGVPGEMCIGGVGVSRGYLGRPELTAERFVPDPWSTEPGRRLYRSGDLVKQRRDGTFEFLRRRDDQVKVRGFRIELGEVQAVLSAHPSVRAAVVTTREDVPGDVRLVAYVVAAEGSTVDSAVLRAAARRDLPEHMVPSAFVAVDTIPRTPNGKLDHRALPAPTDAPRAVVAAGTDLERRIVAVWREVLRVDAIGADDNFFDLGGNSLLLAKTRSRLADELDRDVAAVTLFTYPTVQSLAAHFDGVSTEDSPTRDVAGGRRALLTRKGVSR
ncbi:amino acid adenylation domain-containing protein [Actinosynnema sp. NPDC020468]|uniref:non-ribosomal peptide synthetase n=1 Tax=Actinosynnema sp. NPDC020468 TaxID=3154488 RepID=UPI0033F3B54D